METGISLSENSKSGEVIIDFQAFPDKSEGVGEIIFRLQEPGDPIPVGSPGTRYPASFEAGKSADARFSFKPGEPGHYTVYAVVLIQKPGIRNVEETSIHLNVDAKGNATVVGPPPPVTEMIVNGLRLADVGELDILSDRPTVDYPEKENTEKDDFGTFRIFGRIRYTDKTYTNGAFTGTTLRPVRNARVKLYDVEPGNKLEFLNNVFTDNSGRFKMTILSNDDGPFNEFTRDLRFIITCENADVKVYNIGSNTVRGIEYGDFKNWPGGDLHFTLDIDEAFSGQFNIFHNLNQAVKFARGKGEDPPLLQAEWNKGVSNGDASYYTKSTSRIYLLGDSSVDPDEFDDDVILHEAGHFMMNKLSFDRSPGGSHSSSTLHDTRLAWSEGWATYFGSMVDYNKWYVDHTATDFFSLNIETNIHDGKGERNEAAVAGALWDVYDGPKDGLDEMSDGSARSWNIFTNGIKSTSRAHFRDYYDLWKTYKYPKFSAFDDIAFDHGMEYQLAQVTYPNKSNAVFINNRRKSIKWEEFPGTRVRIRLFRNNSFYRTISNSTNNDGSYSWRVPSNIPPGDNYRVVINDLTSTGFYDSSNEAFSIYPSPRRMSVNGSSLLGSVSGSSDEDWYYFVVSSKGNYKVETFQGSLKDSVIFLYGKNTRSNLLREDDDSGPGLMSRATRYLYPGTYYVRVKGFGSNSGSYTVRVRK